MFITNATETAKLKPPIDYPLVEGFSFYEFSLLCLYQLIANRLGRVGE